MDEFEYCLIDIANECKKIIKQNLEEKKEKIPNSRDATLSIMNKLGKDGWEFCCAHGNDFLFKRKNNKTIKFSGPLFDGK